VAFNQFPHLVEDLAVYLLRRDVPAETVIVHDITGFLSDVDNLHRPVILVEYQSLKNGV
jgi:hypothetical protein